MRGEEGDVMDDEYAAWVERVQREAFVPPEWQRPRRIPRSQVEWEVQRFIAEREAVKKRREAGKRRREQLKGRVHPGPSSSGRAA